MAVLKVKEIWEMTTEQRMTKLEELRDELMHERGVAAMGGALVGATAGCAKKDAAGGGDAKALHACKGLNDCKGQGGCARREIDLLPEEVHLQLLAPFQAIPEHGNDLVFS